MGRFVDRTDILQTKVQPEKHSHSFYSKNMTFMMESYDLPYATLKKVINFARKKPLQQTGILSGLLCERFFCKILILFDFITKTNVLKRKFPYFINLTI